MTDDSLPSLMTDDLTPIGLIAAMNEECRPLLQHVQGWVKCRLGNYAGYRFQLAGKDCLLVQSGIGLQHAGEATCTLLAALHPGLLVSFGVAGAVHDDLHIGDVVSVHTAILLEHGKPGPSVPLAKLTGAALAAVSRALQPAGARIFPGTALTTRGSQIVQASLPNPENPVLEMENAAIAQAAAQSGVPLLALRGISDNPGQPLPFDPDQVMDENYHIQASKLMRIFFRQPGLILQVSRLRRNTAIAAENTAIAAIAALGQNPVIQTG
jgi:nucleoside phosphorylase